MISPLYAWSCHHHSTLINHRLSFFVGVGWVIDCRCSLLWFFCVSFRFSVSQRIAIREKEPSRIPFSIDICGCVCCGSNRIGFAVASDSSGECFFRRRSIPPIIINPLLTIHSTPFHTPYIKSTPQSIIMPSNTLTR